MNNKTILYTYTRGSCPSLQTELSCWIDPPQKVDAAVHIVNKQTAPPPLTPQHKPV